MKIIFGIGNPGQEYRNTRHNLGFLALDSIAKKLELSCWVAECKGLCCHFNKPGQEPIILVKPLTFVNLSGECVYKIQKKYPFSIDSFLVIVDDMSLPFGKLRVRPKGGSSGHNGLKSIMEVFAEKNFPRIRMGIGQDDSCSISSYVLSEFSAEEQEHLPSFVDRAANAALTWMLEGLDSCMNKHN